MRITVPTATLKSALSQVGKVADARSTLPALGCIQIEAHVDGGVTLTATDLQTRAVRQIGATVESVGTALLPHKMLAAFVDALTGEDVAFVVAPNHRATITSGRAEIVLPGLDPEGFPPPGDFEGASADLTLAADVFAEAIAAVAHAVAPDESRPVLAGVSLATLGSTLTLAAADGYQLAVHHIRDLPELPDLNIIVSGKPLAGIISALSGATSTRLVVNENESRLLVETEIGSWHLALIDGAFPDFNRIIPRDPPHAFTASRTALLTACRLVAPVARDNSQITRLRLAGSTLTVSAATGNETAETTVDVDPVHGDGLLWALNNVYLRNALNALDCETVTVEVAGVANPTVIHSGDRGAGVCVVMAMSVVR